MGAVFRDVVPPPLVSSLFSLSCPFLLKIARDDPVGPPLFPPSLVLHFLLANPLQSTGIMALAPNPVFKFTNELNVVKVEHASRSSAYEFFQRKRYPKAPSSKKRRHSTVIQYPHRYAFGHLCFYQRVLSLF